MLKSELTKEQVDTLKVAFSLFDKNGDGCISLDELKQAFAELGQHPSDDEIAQMVNNYLFIYSAIFKDWIFWRAIFLANRIVLEKNRIFYVFVCF